MRIPYLLRQGVFRPKLSEWVDQTKEQIEEGSVVQTDLKKAGGYAGENIKITIKNNIINEFETDWEYKDPTRFPARIRALATVLKDKRMWGSYFVSHKDGIISLRKVAS